METHTSAIWGCQLTCEMKNLWFGSFGGRFGWFWGLKTDALHTLTSAWCLSGASCQFETHCKFFLCVRRALTQVRRASKFSQFGCKMSTLARKHDFHLLSSPLAYKWASFDMKTLYIPMIFIFHLWKPTFIMFVFHLFFKTLFWAVCLTFCLWWTKCFEILTLL